MSAERLTLRVSQITPAARDALVIELRDPAGAELPAFSPGAHIELHLPDGLVRQYSLCGDARQRDCYRVGVGLAPASRGGSRYIHQRMRVGDLLPVTAPRNHFPLFEDAAEFVFFAGGIGITPILSMIHWCETHRRPWRLFYLVRNRERAAFLDQLAGVGERVTLHADEEAGGLFDLQGAISRLPARAHLYTCGPTPLMLAVESAAQGLPAEQVHFEWFTPREIPRAGADSAFTVKLARSGRSLEVPADRSLLQVLEAHGVAVENSCREGTCASCETRVLAGIPEHRDSVLSEAEKRRNDCMMVCVSRAQSATLELDL
ncbi:vanillate O-demethylase ferredoxin subunit [Pseudomonas nitritireducens]|uniref:Vanillate O-demethylase ferredoxin subunit n=1 Tax=Pseudomonas nitroreducens TaxID=46680 RepID=A0A7W7KJ89_PSENT|nr:PDR/VanB family oxidoreductase [Pseudomonas nitritireducens]MBB4863118.1 vanillate O-demethylase ferredoxin subunit [Pseudomonas nitritireducens]